MSKFYCNVCDEMVTLKNGVCPKCKTDWEILIEESTNNEKAKPVKFENENVFGQEEIDDEEISLEKKEITKYDIVDNIDFFVKWAEIGQVFFIIIAIIVAIISFVLIGSTSGFSLLLLLVSGGLIFFAFVFSNSLKWKAYMLHTNFKRKK